MLSLPETVELFVKYNDLGIIFIRLNSEECYNTIYEYLFIIWNISNNKDTLYIFENEEYVTIILKVIKLNNADKIIRIGMMIIKVVIFTFRIYFL